MKDVLNKERVPGAGVALVANGEVLWCGGIGEADMAAKRAVSCDTEFRVGSISKTFVALALLKLQEEGKINLYAGCRMSPRKSRLRIVGKRLIPSAS